MTTVTKEEYWPTILADPTQAGQIKTDDAEWNTRAASIYTVLQNTLCICENKILVAQWEHQLELTPAADTSLADRKAACLYKMTCALPVTPGLLEKALEKILGAGNFSLTRDTEANKVTVAVSLDTTEAQITEVKSLLNRVLPRNLVTEMEWVNGLPIEYTPLEYLECLGGDGQQYINTELYVTQETRVFTTSECTSTSAGSLSFVYGAEGVVNYPVPMALAHMLGSKGTKSTLRYFWNNKATVKDNVVDGRKLSVDYSKNGLYVNGQLQATVPYAEFRSNYPLSVFSSVLQSLWAFYGRIYELKIWESEILMLSFIPALDPTGAPCMFDTVTRKEFYNFGKGDFTYPGKEEEPTTYSLRNRLYGKITEHGIRRLYCVPEGYSSKEEYAEQNGFKLIVEPPMPEEGYWTPVWHDREDCIELEWVETEPPAEEEISIC